MVLSKRERYAGIIAIAVLVVLVFDQLVFSKLMTRREELAVQLENRSKELNEAQENLETSRRAGTRWAEISRGALARDGSSAENRVLTSVSEWAREAGMALSSLKPERTEKEGEFIKITFRATGTGQMNQIGRFLHRVQTSNVPLRISDLTLTSRKEGVDDLTASVGIATVYPAPEDKSRASEAAR